MLLQKASQQLRMSENKLNSSGYLQPERHEDFELEASDIKRENAVAQ